MKAEQFLKMHVQQESESHYGKISSAHLNEIVHAWMDDKENSAARFEIIKAQHPKAKTVLDLASGCGTFVFGGALRGFNVFGVEPENWKNQFNRLKSVENNYPEGWSRRLVQGVGEALPLKSNCFDVVSSYQTLEHVQNMDVCLREILRVVKPGGGIHIQCPDYRSTFEGHYQLPWLPLFPRSLARFYLKLLGRPLLGLFAVHYTTPSNIRRGIESASESLGRTVEILDLREREAHTKFKQKGIPPFWGRDVLFYVLNYVKSLFRKELQVSLWVKVER